MLAAVATLLVVLVVLTPGPRPVRPRPVDLSPATAHDVRILRDTWGVPHVFGRTDRNRFLVMVRTGPDSRGEPNEDTVR